MSGILEALGNQSQLSAALNAGLDSIDRDCTVVFTMYNKTIIPADGWVYWVQTETNETVKGSIHYGIDKQQNEDETIAINRIVFTAEEQIQVFDNISPTTIFIGTYQGINFAFSRQGNYYTQANLWHYTGDAIYPAMQSQIITTSQLPSIQPIVSNSLPIWLSQSSFAPVYPSFLVPDNISPPYVVAHVEPESTEALQGFPSYNLFTASYSPAIGFFNIGNSSIGKSSFTPDVSIPNSGASPLLEFPSNQLSRDLVRLTLYGFNNQQAIQFFVSLQNYSLATDEFGFMNSPIIRDDKRTQTELGIIAQKKTIMIEASYYQSTAYAIAQRLILSAAVTTTFST